MDNETKIQNIQAPNNEEIRPQKRSVGWTVAVVLGCLSTIVGWAALMFAPALSMWVGVGAVVLGICGLRAGRGCLRDLDITSLIAAAVLVAVHLIFMFAVDYAMSSI